MSRWVYADADVLVRVETLRRGDRIYLPGVHRNGPGRVVHGIEVYAASSPAEVPPHGAPARVVVSYFTGERMRPVGGVEPGEQAPLVVSQLRWLEVGTRVRCRRAVRVGS